MNARTCAWCGKANNGRNPFYCPPCVKLHWSPPAPEKPPPPAKPAQPNSLTYYYRYDRATGLGYQD